MDQILPSPFTPEIQPQIPALTVEPPQDTPNEADYKPNLLSRIKEAWTSGNIKTYLTLESMRDEFWTGFNDPEKTKREKLGLVSTTGIAIAGQAYERFRLPETFAASIGTSTYKESLERGHLTATATLAGSVVVGGFVYLQQKIIGRNMIRTARHFPETYDTAKTLWPKQLDVVDNALPGVDEPVKQGIAMVAVGTTPFVMTARANNPEISDKSLRNIERKVTRRGSIASAGAGAIVLGSLSLAPHIPEEVSILDLPGTVSNRSLEFSSIRVPSWASEQLVDKSNLVVDTLSSPVKVIALIALFSALGKAKTMLSHKSEEV